MHVGLLPMVDDHVSSYLLMFIRSMTNVPTVPMGGLLEIKDQLRTNLKYNMENGSSNYTIHEERIPLLRYEEK